MGARQENLRSALFAPDVIDIGANAVARAKHFPRDHFVAPDHGFTRAAAAEIDDDIAIFDPLDDAVDDLADAVFVDFILFVALGLANLLDQHLFGGLRGDAAEIERRQGFSDPVADLGGWVFFLRVDEGDLRGVVFDRIDDQQSREKRISPVFGLMSARTSVSCP